MYIFLLLKKKGGGGGGVGLGGRTVGGWTDGGSDRLCMRKTRGPVNLLLPASTFNGMAAVSMTNWDPSSRTP